MLNGENGPTPLNDDLQEYLSEVEIIEVQCSRAAHQQITFLSIIFNSFLKSDMFWWNIRIF